MKPRTLFFVGAGPEMVPGIRLAADMGLRVVATDRSATAPGFAFACAHEVVSTRDVAGTVAAARRHAAAGGVDGVMTLACDVPLTVAAVADALGLPGLPVAAAALAQNKLRMKEALAAGGTPVPRFAAARTEAEARDACRRVGFPAVMKPVDNSAARGVTLVAGPDDVPRAFRAATGAALADPTVLVEEYLPGPQLSTESIVVEGTLVTTGFADRNYARNAECLPHFVEDGHTVPSEHDPAARAAVESVVARAAASLGIAWGVVKGDIVLTPEGPKVIEIAARLSGGRFSTDTVPLATGVEIVRAAILQAIGAPVDPASLRPRHRRAAAQRYLFPAPGTVVGVRGVEAATRLPGVTRVELYVEAGDRQPPITHHGARAGYVIAEAEDRATAVARAEAAAAAIRIDVVGEEPAEACRA